jgi:hypothetical protein
MRRRLASHPVQLAQWINKGLRTEEAEEDRCVPGVKRFDNNTVKANVIGLCLIGALESVERACRLVSGRNRHKATLRVIRTLGLTGVRQLRALANLNIIVGAIEIVHRLEVGGANLCPIRRHPKLLGRSA